MGYIYNLINNDQVPKRAKYVIKSKRELSQAEIWEALNQFIKANPKRHYLEDEVIELIVPE